ncbi:chromosomal replication initiator protein DnaA [Agromyces atrinae]|jgi:chromosomal replication initiator protein|uniref:Chromosomal replication initiator protein DnaA n=1 Tax=Agromyces atrinae TaxID=592376 RepID=A0A4Q2M7N1_9MICO|nr:chromosomal replication initiator protein DnaA [Agromyces atrinae]MCI2956824.1 chromosomal replication initiator protein DnaA [Agromyces atrinae]NYD67822.1 chromosomal replication initiator protein [Agromyces atrinae]RXZ87998.1 chromosomal replication initiator protein DnaA [Agromyces atrinae]
MADAETPISEIWAIVLDRLSNDDSITPMLQGFLNLVEPKGIAAGTFYLEVPNDFTASMLNQRMRIPMLAAMSELESASPVTSFYVVVNPELEQEARISPEPIAPVIDSAPAPVMPINPHSVFEQPAPDRPGDTRLNAKYSFDNFVIGQSNRFAHAAAVAVAEAPAKAYNPLFIYGESGLGKTHLLHAIGHYAMSLYPGVRVRYVSSEEFTNDFINSIANNRGSLFQQRYRNIDILLIDDIQFLQGKAETQEAFFHTFNTLHDHNKQVVITSDLPPKHLTGFEDRMRSRFEWGLITDVQAPDLETRIAILRKKAQSDRLQVPDDILEYIATKVSSNIRELEGTLIRVTAFSSLNRTPVDMQLVQTVLKDLITLDEDNVIAPVDIIQNTADYFKLTVDDLYGSSRSQAVATARQIAMYLCRELTNLSLPKIGQLFGNRDHTTVMYANKKISELMKERRSIYNQVTELTARIKQTNRYR